MGLYDREYYRGDDPGFRLKDFTLVTHLVIVNVVLFLANFLFSTSEFSITGFLALQPENLAQPLYWWRLLTYGFVHDPNVTAHVAMNMFVLWMFGRDVEGVYGRYELLRFYLLSIVLGGLFWASHNYFQGANNQLLLGASGGVTAVFMLFVCHFPKRTILLFFIIPVPAWLVGALFLLGDMFGARTGRQNVAFDVHLVGAACAMLYWWTGWRLYWLAPSYWWRGRGSAGGGGGLLRRKPKLKVHAPRAESEEEYRVLDEQADAVLEKVAQRGIESLSPSERRVLEAYSRRMQQKHR